VTELYLDDVRGPGRGSGRLLNQAKCQDGRRFGADFFVLANGLDAKALARSIFDTNGTCKSPICIPLYGVRRYSLTLMAGTISEVWREQFLQWPCITWEPLGLTFSAFRSSGGDNKCGELRSLHFSSLREITSVESPQSTHCAELMHLKVSQVLPFLTLKQATVSCDFSAWSPDDLPVVSGTRCPNLFLNTGHGSNAWRLACGSAEVLAHLMGENGKSLQLDPIHLSLKRFCGGALFSKQPHEMSFPEFSERVGLSELKSVGRRHE